MIREKALETIIVLALVSLVISLRFKIDWLIYVSIGLLGISLISTKITLWISALWMSFSHYFGLVMNYILMFVIFFAVLTPLAFFKRLFGGNVLQKKAEGDSYFLKNERWYSSRDIDRPW